jgi:hypothetical protein
MIGEALDFALGVEAGAPTPTPPPGLSVFSLST